MKKTLLSLLLLFSLLLLTGCGTVGSESESVIEGSLEELLAKVTEGVEPDIMVMETYPHPRKLFSSYLFIDYVEGSEGLASDAAINAIAHSVVLLRLPGKARMRPRFRKRLRKISIPENGSVWKRNPARWQGTAI